MQEAKKSMKEKGIKDEDVKNLPHIEEIHGLDTPPPPNVVEVNSLIVRTPILSHIDLACNTSYHFAASRMVYPWVPSYLARDHLRLWLTYMIVLLASI